MALGVCDAKTLLESSDDDFALAIGIVSEKALAFRRELDANLATQIINKLSEAMK